MCVEVRPTDDTYLSRTCINEEVQYDNSGDDDDDDLIVQESDWLERCHESSRHRFGAQPSRVKQEP